MINTSQTLYRLMPAAVLIALVLIPLGASAHTVGFDREITATLHFGRDDKPVAGAPTAVRIIDIKDQGGRFTAAGCDCTLDIYQSGRPPYIVKLAADGPDLTAQYTFPARGNYELHVRGVPRSGADFSPFNINYTQRIDHSAVARSTSSGVYLLASIAAMLVIMSVVAMRLLRPERVQSQ